jgi:hypothetical protein
MIFNSYYKFRIKKLHAQCQYIIEPIEKSGENEVFDELFECPQPLKLTTIGPLPHLFDYYAEVYSTINKHESALVIKFESCSVLNDCGIVKTNSVNNDSIFYRICGYNEYEVLISRGTRSQRGQLFSMFVERKLEDQVETLKNIF